MHSDLPALLKVSAGRNVSSHAIAEFASIICTDPKREAGRPVQRKSVKCNGKAYLCSGKLIRAAERLTRAMERHTWCSGKLVFTTSHHSTGLTALCDERDWPAPGGNFPGMPR